MADDPKEKLKKTVEALLDSGHFNGLEQLIEMMPLDEQVKFLRRIGLAELSHITEEFGGYDAEEEVHRTTLSPENFIRFLEIIDQEEFPDEIKERLRRGIKESASGQTTVLDLDDLAPEDE